MTLPSPSEVHAGGSSDHACHGKTRDLREEFGLGNLVPVTVREDAKAENQNCLARIGPGHAVVLCRKNVLHEQGKSPKTR